DFSRVPSHLRFAVDACRAGQECAFFEDEYRCPVLADELADSILTLAGMERRAAGSVIHLAGADRIDRWWFGVRLLKVLGFPTGLVRRGSAKKMSIIRPSDCSLDCSRAKRIAGISLRGVKEVLGEQCPRGNQDG
ncbi:MAG: hypothetical protein U9N45_03040, partial [Gemmatimonadota bacterium]|nr:hypothetical protein [Gemmatimonadota bacterium]